MRRLTPGACAAVTAIAACTLQERAPQSREAGDRSATITQVEAAVWAFHAADTAKDAEAVTSLLWPEYAMLVDGQRVAYPDVVAGSRAFMGGLELFHTEWTDLRITPLGRDAAIASFFFRDSIVTREGEVIRSRGPNTFVWQRRGGVWKLLFGDADHYPIEG